MKVLAISNKKVVSNKKAVDNQTPAQTTMANKKVVAHDTFVKNCKK